MSILIFIVVLVVLIVVHELGHFFVAKWSGMRVEEFGLGYPPRAWTIAKRGDTEYTLNWLPFGGFVRIYGEDALEEGKEAALADPRAFAARPRILQALTLIAGIAMNLLFAYLLITITLAIGTPRALSAEEAMRAQNAAITVADVVKGSPAEQAGFQVGDRILSASNKDTTYNGYDPEAFTAFIAKDTHQEPLTFSVDRNGKELTVNATPKTNVSPTDVTKPALGVAIAVTGVIPESLWQAPIDGAIYTWEITKATAIGLVQFFGSIFTFSANLSQVSGPVGIAGAVGHASSQGIAALLSITAIISINLALINIIPMPALDGGRLLFVIIEAITRKPIKPIVANTLNTVGFGLLILLMIVVTAHDIFKIVS